ncbi:FadR/GntR family transcriptional regulator [Tepidibacillus fermentans]|uniref:GntR family transcriptional regulator n=1 Tax=Tepidibacillus fermentans TaxID=1281767 RepID=A0A4R3KHE3_9BACI|nr:FadR/GntR family transcriptional regulator [Tepidibacillus fermentans]TCS82091.1 GntR family transcriptional regulator [Tepidibacillus fermentans]
MKLKQIKPQKIYERVAEQLKEMILDGTLKPGERLLSVRELAEELQVGRSAVREALSALSAMGLIEIRQGEGTFVKKFSEADLLSFDVSDQLIDIDQIKSLMEVRKIIEVSAVELAAQRRTNEDLFHLEEALNRMKEDLKTLDENEAADWMFHYAIAKATKNNMLVHIIESISDSIKKNLKTNRKILFSLPGTPEQLLEEHSNIFHAIEKRDSQEARKLMLEHLQRVEDKIFVLSNDIALEKG